MERPRRLLGPPLSRVNQERRGFYGYKLHLVVCTRTDLPLGWEVRTSREADMRLVEPLLKQLSKRGIRPASVAMDKGYDYQAVYQACQASGALAVVAARRNSGTGEGPIDRGSNTFKRLYRARSAVEREFGRLKHHLGLAPLRVRWSSPVFVGSAFWDSCASGSRRREPCRRDTGLGSVAESWSC